MNSERRCIPSAKTAGPSPGSSGTALSERPAGAPGAASEERASQASPSALSPEPARRRAAALPDLPET